MHTPLSAFNPCNQHRLFSGCPLPENSERDVKAAFHVITQAFYQYGRNEKASPGREQS